MADGQIVRVQTKAIVENGRASVPLPKVQVPDGEWEAALLIFNVPKREHPGQITLDEVMRQVNQMGGIDR